MRLSARKKETVNNQQLYLAIGSSGARNSIASKRVKHIEERLAER
jgi:hypothetical protein